ncbi:MAG: hypothetical protein P8Y45_00395 [Exilibacterium sp.]
MQTKRHTKLTGVALALAAAGLAACAVGETGNVSGVKATTDLVHCYGVNQCKGHNDCKTAENACAGQGSCKGHGFVAVPSDACNKVGGSRKDAWQGSVAKADLMQCYGVNSCKGLNDCKTANNACAGHGACKGHGFVSMSTKACADLGGKTKS